MRAVSCLLLAAPQRLIMKLSQVPRAQTGSYTSFLRLRRPTAGRQENVMLPIDGPLCRILLMRNRQTDHQLRITFILVHYRGPDSCCKRDNTAVDASKRPRTTKKNKRKKESITLPPSFNGWQLNKKHRRAVPNETGSGEVIKLLSFLHSCIFFQGKWKWGGPAKTQEGRIKCTSFERVRWCSFVSLSLTPKDLYRSFPHDGILLMRNR